MASLRGLVPVGGFGRAGLPGMFSLAAPDRIRDVLTGAGFTGVAVRQVEAYGEWGHGPRTRWNSCWAPAPGAT
ncbi:hypothetical protein DF17_01630 [Streptomyces rimosus]|nr:hypothetical protein DF17_01630 [Streptomyces rimosus]KEF16814.1 hypothetical protein DF18_32925 [Streptomyces rimosus]